MARRGSGAAEPTTARSRHATPLAWRSRPDVENLNGRSVRSSDRSGLPWARLFVRRHVEPARSEADAVGAVDRAMPRGNRASGRAVVCPKSPQTSDWQDAALFTVEDAESAVTRAGQIVYGNDSRLDHLVKETRRLLERRCQRAT
jgi:hypothetical protein